MWIELHVLVTGTAFMCNTDGIDRITPGTSEGHDGSLIVWREHMAQSTLVAEGYEEIKKLLGSANPLVGPVKRADPVYVDTSR